MPRNGDAYLARLFLPIYTDKVAISIGLNRQRHDMRCHLSWTQPTPQAHPGRDANAEPAAIFRFYRSTATKSSPPAAEACSCPATKMLLSEHACFPRKRATQRRITNTAPMAIIIAWATSLPR